jgi:hypothetical protein
VVVVNPLVPEGKAVVPRNRGHGMPPGTV